MARRLCNAELCLHVRPSFNQPQHLLGFAFPVIRKEAWSFYRIISGVRLCWELEEPKGPKGKAAWHRASHMLFLTASACPASRSVRLSKRNVRSAQRAGYEGCTGDRLGSAQEEEEESFWRRANKKPPSVLSKGPLGPSGPLWTPQVDGPTS